MTLGFEPHKNSLSISLIDPIVFLRGVDYSSRRSIAHEDAPPSILRGLLTLCLTKPTRISSIQVDLVGQSVVTWSEGSVRPIEMRDENKLFSASQTFFQAPQRRAFSAPGEDEFTGRVSSPPPIHSLNSTHFFHLFDPPRGRERARSRFSVGEAIVRPAHSQEVHLHSPTARDTQSHIPSQEDVSILPAHPLRHDPHKRTSSQSSLTHSMPPTSPPIDFPYEGQSFSRTLLDQMVSDTPLNELYATVETPSVPPSPLPSSRPGSRSPSVSHPSLSTTSGPYLPRQHGFSAPSSRHNSFDGTEENTPATLRSHSRERNSARFSFAGVSNSILGAMRGLNGTSEERGRSRRSGGSRGEGQSSGKGSEIVVRGSDEHKDAGDGWQVFKKGLYTFPISFSIPSCMPPTISCDYGSITWRLKANVHRPGAFMPKLSASREVILVTSPSDDRREDTEGFAIERIWEDQMQYTLSVSGRMFPIGDTILITLSFLPMAKVRIYKISVLLEEQVAFFTFEPKVRRTDYPRCSASLFLESRDKDSPLLPLSQTTRNSPLHDLPSELAADLMGPGPWTLQMGLKVPNASMALHFSNNNRRGPIQISHTLKIVVRVERGDDKQMDPKTGQRKQSNVILQMPVHILSPLASAQHIELPRYTETQNAPPPVPLARASRGGRRYSLPPSRHTFAPQSLITAGPLEPFVPPEEPSREADTQYERSAIFERLITGQQSEAGVVPPAYSATQ
ncbi:hypothetical protein EDB85DRAFT_1982737 [Lactarius pseudohatsudake]|nr:hypothetical protein EDB85DRAFT_1982737 [Lactarius pseudohatsudake]